ncbi:MAG TPA: DUF2304 domain-containing protein [Chitinophagaceae bacterium]|nr:DUF2304 domain-containing protein [Chitinophagaceae bacterium]
MTPIQLVLLFSLCTAFFLYWKLFQNRFLNRLMLLAVFVVIVLFVLKPSISTRIANLLGVGRGTDLVLYLGIVIMAFVLLLMYSKIKKLEEMVTGLLRQQSLKKNDENNAE